MLIRFDDVIEQCDRLHLLALSDMAHDRGCEVMWAVSPLRHMSAERDYVVPRIFRPRSTLADYYKPDQWSAVCEAPPWVAVASHGLIHADHRLLPREACKLSIAVSCSLLRTSIFVPPYNGCDETTQSVCDELHVQLVRFVDGWRSVEHHRRIEAPDVERWYLHARNVSRERFAQWLDGK